MTLKNIIARKTPFHSRHYAAKSIILIQCLADDVILSYHISLLIPLLLYEMAFHLEYILLNLLEVSSTFTLQVSFT